MQIHKGLSIYYVSSYNEAGSVRMLTNAYLRDQGFIEKLMSSLVKKEINLKPPHCLTLKVHNIHNQLEKLEAAKAA